MHEFQRLGEAFVPVAGGKLETFHHPELNDTFVRRIPRHDGAEWMMPREERFNVFRPFVHQNYPIKIRPTDVVEDPRILPWLIENDYTFITLSRRNHFEAFVSWLIAYHHNIWTIRKKDRFPEWGTFTATPPYLTAGAHVFECYFQTLRHIPAEMHVYYEDIVCMSPQEIVEQCGVYQPGFPTPASKSVKLMDFESKKALIENLDTVEDFFLNKVVRA